MTFLRLGNAFLIGFALDAALSILDESLKLAGSDGILAVRNAVASMVLLAVPPMAVLVATSPRLPFGIFLPAIFACLWLSFGAAPLPALFLGEPTYGLATSLVQAGFAALAFGLVRARGSGWLLTPEAMPGPDGSYLRLFGSLVIGVVLGLPLALAYLLVWGMTAAHVATAGFVGFDGEGVNLAERRYVRADREVRLVGMMHIGEGDRYTELYESFARPSTVVLEEGVRDESGLLERRLSFAPIATRLGLESQGSISRYFAEEEAADEDVDWPHFRNPDVDVADLAPETREFIERAAEIWDGEDPRGAIFALVSELQANPDAARAIERDIIFRRNELVITEVDATLPEYRHIVVPWGALHLPAIEQALLARGFELDGESQHRFVYWKRVVEALLRRGE